MGWIRLRFGSGEGKGAALPLAYSLLPVLVKRIEQSVV